LQVAYQAPFHNKGTKYILSVCPWNADHTNHSAYLIQFADGGIAAGCHHNSCKNENWKTLQELLGPDAKNEQADSQEESQSDLIIRLAADFQYFTSDIEEPYAAVEINGHVEVMDIKSKRFKLYLTKLFFEETRKAPSGDAGFADYADIEARSGLDSGKHVYAVL
jgi:hypothetical protein